MRSAELLTALAQAPGGIQVNACQDHVTVATRYTPLVRGQSKTIFDAASACAREILDYVGRNPGFGRRCPDVLAALEKYDLHSMNLQL